MMVITLAASPTASAMASDDIMTVREAVWMVVSLCASVARDERLCGGQRGSVNRYYSECLTRLWSGIVELRYPLSR